VKLTIAAIAGRARSKHFDALVSEYLARIQSHVPAEAIVFKTSEVFFESVERQRTRAGSSTLVLLDARGKQLSSEELARWLGRQRDGGQQQIVFGIGPADGWSDAERRRAGLLLSLGPMTLPHELARVVLSEQIYRAFTILAGHPYHTGH
jgi:23S rRNA (pseudouridine1915-N3)-methyltransferase